MFNIADFLGKFSKNINNTEQKEKDILEIINQETNLKIEDLEIKNNIVYINTILTNKTLLFVKKQKILNNILEKTGVKIVDIR